LLFLPDGLPTATGPTDRLIWRVRSVPVSGHENPTRQTEQDCYGLRSPVDFPVDTDL
jgi:hypothetical protein